jgi:hypothetical protein
MLLRFDTHRKQGRSPSLQDENMVHFEILAARLELFN